jgi:hypothetical protein
MMSRSRRLTVAVGIAVAWYFVLFVVVYGLSMLVGEKYDIEWLVHLLLFPLSVLSWIVMQATERFGTLSGGEKQLPHSVMRGLMVIVPLLHFAFVTLVAYGVVSWRAFRRTHGPSSLRRA